MGTPTKRRKLNNTSKSSPVAPRSLDYFFGKQKQNIPSPPPNNSRESAERSGDLSEFTDEQLARKLQAEWDQEAAGGMGASAVTSDTAANSAGPAAIDENNVFKQVAEGKYPNGTGGQDEDFEGANNAVKIEPGQSQTKGKNTLSLQSTGSEEDTITSNIPFDESPLTFEPSKYVSELQSHWAGERGNASYALLTRCFVLVNGTQSRIKIVDTLVNLLRVIIEGDPSSLLPTVRTKYDFCHMYNSNLESFWN
jgi:DNA ligase-1